MLNTNEVNELVSLEDALSLILPRVHSVAAERVGLNEALGRILARDVVAPFDVPPFNRSPLDGYALRAEDVAAAAPGNPIRLQVVRELPAGKYSSQVVYPKQTVKISTGAPIPDGANAVVRFEDVRRAGAQIQVFQPVQPFSNYCFAGEDMYRGETVVCEGTLLGSAAIAVLASLGYARVPVYRQPQVALLSTGNELVEGPGPLQPGKIYNSSLPGLAAAVTHLGAEAVVLGTAPDRPGLIGRAISQALELGDLVLTTGGVSVGDYDLVRRALALVGARILFWRVNIRPGTPALAAVKDGKLIIGLSGNPAAAFISFHVLARPVLAKLTGLGRYLPLRTSARFIDSYSKTCGQRRFLRGHAFPEDGEYKIKLSGLQSPGMIKSMLDCNALIDLPPHSGGIKPGDRVEVILLNGELQT